MKISNLFYLKDINSNTHLAYKVNNKFISVLTFESVDNIESEVKLDPFYIKSKGNELLCIISKNYDEEHITIIQRTNNSICKVYPLNSDFKYNYEIIKVFFFNLLNNSLNKSLDYEKVHYLNAFIKSNCLSKRLFSDIIKFKRIIPYLKNIPIYFHYIKDEDVKYINENNITYLIEYLKQCHIYDTIELKLKIGIERKRQNLLNNITIDKKYINNELVFIIDYPIYFINEEIIRYIVKKIKLRNNYLRDDYEFVEKLSFDTGLSSRIIHSIRNTTLIDMAMRTVIIVEYNIINYIKEYNPDMMNNIYDTIYHFCSLHGTHPGTTYNKIIKMFKQNIQFKKLMLERGYNIQFNKEISDRIFKDDSLSSESTQFTSYIAEHGENMIIELFRSIGIDFLTEDEIKMEIKKQYDELISKQDPEKIKKVGNIYKNHITPDILLKSKVIFNGQEIKWIEYKNNTCIGRGIVYRKNLEQYNKYRNNMGIGLVLYGGAISESIITDQYLSIGLDLNK